MFLCIHRYANLIIDKAMRTIVVGDVNVGFFFVVVTIFKQNENSQNKKKTKEKIVQKYKIFETKIDFNPDGLLLNTLYIYVPM